jgi:hypothetical protein
MNRRSRWTASSIRSKWIAAAFSASSRWTLSLGAAAQHDDYAIPIPSTSAAMPFWAFLIFWGIAGYQLSRRPISPSI